MTTLISADPGKDRVWWSFFHQNMLQHSGFVACPIEVLSWQCDILVVERPQIYRSQGRGEDPNDLIDLALSLGQLIARVEHLEYVEYKPNQWKGQVPKEIMKNRIIKALKRGGDLGIADGCLRDVAPGLRHNMYDSIGIGLKHLGRL